MTRDFIAFGLLTLILLGSPYPALGFLMIFLGVLKLLDRLHRRYGGNRYVSFKVKKSETDL